MTYTVEDTLEILAGVKPRLVNIRIDYNEKNLIRSLGRQVANGLALTDRQLELALKKIQKYQANLEKNNVDVTSLLLTKPLRMPIREIDRSQTISITTNESGKSVILIKGARTKNFQEKWAKIEGKIVGEVLDSSTLRQVPLNEINIAEVVSAFQGSDFDIDPDLLAIFEEIEKILENPSDFAPYVELDSDQIIVKNANKNLLTYLDENFSQDDRENILSYIDKLKICGLYYKNPKISEKIQKLAPNSLVKDILTSPGTRFRVDPDQYPVETLVEAIDTIDQWPVIVLVDDDQKALEQVSSVFSAVSTKVSTQDITVFFRIDTGQKNSSEFSQFVKDNHLNNYIGPNTKIVFIAKNKIPKPLLKADWKPRTAIMMCNHDFGKTSAFLDDLSTVYYYNKSVVVRNNRIKGARPIAQL